jgi:bacteriocin-like protein
MSKKELSKDEMKKVQGGAKMHKHHGTEGDGTGDGDGGTSDGGTSDGGGDAGSSEDPQTD